MELIEIPKDRIKDAVKAAYDLSYPVGLGYLHYEDDPLTDEEAEKLINFDDKWSVVHMDYVKGRCCKFDIFEKDGKYYTYADWHDHTEEQLKELLKRIGLS